MGFQFAPPQRTTTPARVIIIGHAPCPAAPHPRPSAQPASPPPSRALNTFIVTGNVKCREITTTVALHRQLPFDFFRLLLGDRPRAPPILHTQSVPKPLFQNDSTYHENNREGRSTLRCPLVNLISFGNTPTCALERFPRKTKRTIRHKSQEPDIFDCFSKQRFLARYYGHGQAHDTIIGTRQSIPNGSTYPNPGNGYNRTSREQSKPGRH